MHTRPLTYAAIAGALAAPLLAMTPASATSGPVGSAFGISASGIMNVAAMPSVTSTASTVKKREMTWTKFPSNPIVKDFAMAHVSAMSGEHSMAIMNYVVLLAPKVSLPAGTPKIPAGLVLAKVAAARCDNGKGQVELAKVQVAGKTIKVGSTPNKQVAVPLLNLGKVTATFDKQVRNSNGTLTVTAIELKIALGGKSETVDISSATCGRSAGTTPTPAPTGNPAPASGGEAPVPTPVKSDLPVTG